MLPETNHDAHPGRCIRGTAVTCRMFGSLGLPLAVSILGMAISVPALADDAPKAMPDKSGYSLFNPTPDSALRDFSADRPSKSISPITVDAGHFQIETDFLNYTHTDYQGTTTRAFQAGDPTFKLGLTNWIDFEFQLGGYQRQTATDTATGAVTHGHGFGDVYLRSKINLLGNDGGKVAIAVVPYVKLPSGTTNISNGKVEGGVQLPIQVTLPSDFVFVYLTEIDALKNAMNFGTQANFVNVVNLSHPIPGIKDLTGTVEFYSSVGTDRFTPPVYTFDAALSYMLTPTTQIDSGVNVGLNRAAPNLQVYAGISQRF